MELKLLANTELRKKFHYIRRLRKAASHAGQLEELCYAEACDARTKLEAQVCTLYVDIVKTKIIEIKSTVHVKKGDQDFINLVLRKRLRAEILRAVVFAGFAHKF